MARALRVFVIMPFGNRNEYRDGANESDHIFEQIIRPAVQAAQTDLGPDAGIHVDREVDKNETGSVTSSIIKSLVEADIVIADLTGHNANVFFELGIRLSLRRKLTILLAQRGTALPFDIQNYRYVEYHPLGVAAARQRLAQFITTGLHDDRVHRDSLVFDTYPSMTVRIPGVLEAVGDAAATDYPMSWEEYFGKIEWLGDLLKDALNDGSFAPDAVIGISNGGLIVADLLSRNYLRGTPVVSLWANRFKRATSHACWYFKNSYNDSLLAALRREVKEQRGDDPASVLLVDDRVGTGQTALQAIDYLREELSEKTRLVFLPLVVSRPEYVETIKAYLPCNAEDHSGRRLFRMPEADFIRRLVTDAKRFPYKKAISDALSEPIA